jgi:DNA-binding transcriptional MerR regulator
MTAARSADQQVAYSVGQVAELFGVTVRTLHHYDDIGLLVPSERSRAGYRLYTDTDLTRLANIVVYRRLELPLERIARLLDDDADVVGHLRRQRAAVQARLGELTGLVAAIDEALERQMSNQPATPSQMRSLFGESFDEWQAEAKTQWGDTDAYQESARRTKAFTKADWQRVKDEGDAINAVLVAGFTSGEPAASERGMGAAEVHRKGIERFYGCSYEMHRGLADMYLADPRFTAYYEDLAPGLAQWVHDAIYANSARHGG